MALERRSRAGRAAPALILGVALVVLVGIMLASVVYLAARHSARPRSPADAGTASTAARSTAARAADAPFLPDSTKTPGATLPVTSADICVPGYSRKVRNVPSEVKRSVYSAYGVTHHEPGEYEVDHLISLELGGSNSAHNLWPESYRSNPWNAHVKDALENELHRRVCAGEVDLATAQREIAGNWIAAYRKYFHTDHPLPPHR